jgi:hypothetical protein
VNVVVAGVISLPPFVPGIAWDWLHYALGLRDLGHDVTYLEELDSDWCVDPGGEPCAFEDSLNRRLFRETMERFELEGLQLLDGTPAPGSEPELSERCRAYDVLLNISGHARSPRVLDGAGRRAYIDQDPVYTQLWIAEYGQRELLDGHDVFFTHGLNIGTSRTHIPDGGIAWNHLLPPVVLDRWPVANGAAPRRFTTIASWTTYSDLEYDGEWYRSKYAEFDRFADLPSRVNSGTELEVALQSWREGDPGIERLREGGWHLSEAGRIGTLDGYQRFIAESRGEIGIAKEAYVKGRSGWFSDRATHYLASGRPVLAQATGFEEVLPTGEGLLAFATPEEAAAAIADVDRRYDDHCRAARAWAETHLDHRRVLPEVLERCLSA